MNHRALLLGIDISTTGAKALLINEMGEVVHSVTTELSLSTPRPLWSEQDPSDWWEGVVRSIRRVIQEANIIGDQIKAIGLTGQMHGLVLLDESGEVLRPAILWNDQRTGRQCDEIRAVIGRQRFINITGNDVLTGFTAPKILWVKENEPDIYKRARHILLPKDYIRYKLTNEYATDKAGASGTVLFNLKERNWSGDLCKELEIPEEWLPSTFEGPEITGRVGRKPASETLLHEGTPVVGGGGDQAAQAVGVGVVKPGVIALTLGTSGVVFAATDSPIIETEGRLHAFCHALPDHWHLMGVMLSAAGSYQWYRDTLRPGVTYDELNNEAMEVEPGCEGLLFLPYLTGERTPYPDPYARAGWIGLTIRHKQKHMTRAVLEGVAFGIKDSFSLIRDAGLGKIGQVRISGGGAKSHLWRKILASTLDTELVTVNTTEGAAYGAALLAGVGVGFWHDVQSACSETVTITGREYPDPEQVPVYSKSYENYRLLYPSLKPVFDSLK